MTTLDDLDLFPDGPDAPRPGAAPARKCKHPRDQRVSVHFALDRPDLWHFAQDDGLTVCEPGTMCALCYRRMDAAVARRGRNNRKRGVSDELTVARILGGSKVGPLGLPWDVVVEGHLRAQCKKTTRWPSLNDVVRWLDAIPAGPELRAVTLADAPGHGRVRRLIVLDLDEYARWHGRSET